MTQNNRVIIDDPEHAAVTDALFASDESTNPARDTTEPTAPPPRPLAKPTGKPRGIQLRPAHTKFVTEFMKTPYDQRGAYMRAYPAASPKRASERAYRLLRRPDIRAEIQRRQKISETKNAVSRARVEQQLFDLFTFDLRRLYYPATVEDGTPHPRAGQPKEPCDLDDDCARVVEAYKHMVTKQGSRREFKIGSRKDMAELLAKMRGWIKQDTSPPIVANFHFDFGPPPVEGEVIQTVPLHLSGLKDASTPSVRPLDGTEQPEEGVELPPGYRGVRPGGRAHELAEIFAPREGKKP